MRFTISWHTKLYRDCFCKLIIYIVSRVLDRNNKAAFSATNYGDALTAVAAEGKEKGVEIFIRKVAPLGDPMELNLRGYELSLRKADAEMVEII